MLIDFSQCLLSEKDGSYGGNAGQKRGIVYNGENWFLKYPQSTAGMQGHKLPPYTSSPFSEYVGSHIYEFLGVPVHETVLGFDVKTDGARRLVCACKDFVEPGWRLDEFRSLKNAGVHHLGSFYDDHAVDTSSSHLVDLEEVLMHLRVNPLVATSEMRERFNEMLAVDAILDNYDRNNGNWGLLRKGSESKLAPVLDNGNSFSNKIADEFLVDDVQTMLIQWLDGRSIYKYDGKQLSNERLYASSLVPNLPLTCLNMAERYFSKREEIATWLDSIPEFEQDVEIASKQRKDAYLKGMDVRAAWLIDDEHVLERVMGGVANEVVDPTLTDREKLEQALIEANVNVENDDDDEIQKDLEIEF